MANPWAHSRTENEFDDATTPTEPLSAYAVPAANSGLSEHDGWLNNPGGGYAPSLRISPTDIPDETRLNPGGEFVTTHAPADGTVNAYAWWAIKDADRKERHSVEQIATTGFEETKRGFGLADPSRGANRYGRNPREIPPAETRPTESMSGHKYLFQRPFTGNTPHDFTGIHFSMADHRRNYEIYGQTPPRRPGGTHRNTYRLPPTPWDTNIVDMPPDTRVVQDNYQDVAVPMQSRSLRLM
jgi:hypothetical protein